MAALTLSDEDFLTQSLFHTGLRADGRRSAEFRKLDIRLGPGLGQAECSIGKTRTRAVVTGALTKPPPNRPREGRLSVNVEAGPMAAPATLPSGNPTGLVGSSQTPEGVSLCNQLERMLKGLNAVDVEALCVQSGALVWELRLDVHVLCDCGNVGDSAAIASIVALRHYRQAEVSVENGDIIYSPHLDPVPLSVHHMPIPVTFAAIPSGLGEDPMLLADPSNLEEQFQGDGGQLVVVMNQYGELCSVLKSGGASLLLDRDLMPAVRLTTARVKAVIALVDDKLAEDEHTRFDVHKADIHHKYAASGLSIENGDAILPLQRDQRKRRLAHLEVPQPMQLDKSADEQPSNPRKSDSGGAEDPLPEPTEPGAVSPAETMYSVKHVDNEGPAAARASPPAPTVSEPATVDNLDDDDLDDLSAAVLVKPKKKKRRPRK
ncbi:Exosome complex component RRP45 [Perkinsus olseni]|nr:Exosome complex component RRP45 [Perkinsus olseni]